ncbi:unnamed protein product [Phytophthora fragariaefolia]|uniref:Unnamed protein product n=1 Tax=Phytophthora fragariaefolia TaxID=1490495 RepID=A0A9W6YJN6_9STRA|nr:unnamed protein product [Phytophthora fragariaefolia]
MEGTNTPQDRWCEPFQLCMEGGASNWIRQLPKKTRSKWSRLCEAFMAYYCSQYDQSAEDRYYTAKRDDDEHICDYLLRLHGYARSAKIMYETGGPGGARHVKRFLDTCEDDALVRQLIPQRFDNIAKVEAGINDTMASDRRRKDRGNSSRKPSREGGRRNDSGRRDDRRADREDRRGDGRGRREDRYSRQVTVAEASVDELYDAWQSRLAITPRRRAVSDSGLDYTDRSCKSECESDGGYVDTAETGRVSAHNYGNIGVRTDGQNRPHGFMGDGRRDDARRPRWGDQDRRARPEYGPCAACGDPRHSVHRSFRRCKFRTQVHRDGQCEHYKLYEDTVKFIKSKHGKDSLPSELQLSEPAVEANFVFGFVKRSEWQEDINAKDFGCEQDGGSCPVEESTILKPSEPVGELSGVITSAAFRERRTNARVETRRMLKGERRGWWSVKQFDRRKRMRALVMGAVNDWRKKILLDTGANISAVSESFARKLRLRRRVSLNKKIEIQGIAKDKVYTQERAKVKLTLGWELVCEFDVWIMPHCAGVDVILGTDFMIPAGVRLDLFRSTMSNPEEVVVPLIKSLREVDEQSSAKHVPGSPNDALDVPPGSVVEFKLQRNSPSWITHDLWVRRTNRLYRDWQALAFAAATDGQLSDKERLLYEEWLAQQPPAVERRQYAAPGGVRSRPLGAPHGPTCEEQWKQLDERTGTDDGTKNGVIDEVSSNQADSSISEEVNASSCPLDAGEHEDLPHEKHRAWEPGENRSANEGINATGQPEDQVDEVGPAQWLEVLRQQAAGMRALSARPELVRGTFLDGMGGVTEPVYVTIAGLQEMDDEITASTTDDPSPTSTSVTRNEIHFEDYAHELAFLPDLTVPASPILDYDAPNVKNPTLDPIAQLKLVETLRRHEEIMIASGNALPPPAYGVVCDIDVRGHTPIKQRARRIPLKYLRKMYELLKGLLEAGLIAFSSSPWASPIVIVLKKNGQDIRLCIDYKMVNAITLIMEYAMPLVDDLLTEMESYLWFCSLDAASGFWAIMMTMRARWVSAFVYALGHFEWLRMPFGLKNAPMIYQRMIDNALWGYVQPKGGWEAFAQRMKDAEAKALALQKRIHGYIAKIADLGSASTTDQPLICSLSANQTNQSWPRCSIGDHSSTTSVSVGLCSTSARKHSTGSWPDSPSVGSVSASRRASSPSAQGVLYAIGGEDPACLHTFLDSRMGVPVQVVIRSHSAVRCVSVSMAPQDQARPRTRHCEFAKLLQSSITPFVPLDEAVAPLAPPSKGSATVRMAPHLLYASITRGYDGNVLSFDGSAKTEKHDGHGRCSWILWKLPVWDIVIAASAHLPSTTVNIAEYTGMNNGVKSAIEYGVTNLVIVGDSRLAIQQSMGVIACRKETLQLKLSQHKGLTAQLKSTRYLHVVRAYNAAADSLATEALESQVTKGVLSESRKTELKALNKIPEVLYVDEPALAETNLPAQRMQPIPQNETHAESQTVEEPQVTAEAVNEVDDLPADQNSPISPQGDAQRSAREGTRNLETTLDEPARADPKEASEREDPTTVQTERIRRVRVAQDEERRWADLKAYLRGDVESLSFKRAANASPTKLPRLNRRRASRDNPHVPSGQEGLLLGRPVRHGNTARPRLRRLQHQQRETPFKGLFAGHCARRATLPTAVHGFCDTPAKDSAREHIAAAVPVFVYGLRDRQGHEQHQGTGRRRVIGLRPTDTTRKETPFYLVHGWDAQSTLKAITSSLRLGDGSLTDAAAWRREANRQHEVALAMAK